MLRFGVLVLGVLPLGAVLAVAQPADTLYARAYRAFENGQPDESVRLLERVAAGAPDHAEAAYLLARLYLDPARLDAARARKTLERALDRDPENVRYLTLRLQLLRDHPPRLVPAYQEWKRKELAERILALDSTVALASLELGEHAAQTYLTRRHAVSITYLSPPAPRPNDAFVGYDAEQDRRHALGALVLDQSGPAAEAYDRAVAHLERALASDPALRAAYAPLLRLYVAEAAYDRARAVVRIMEQQFPEDAAPWLYAGMVAFYSGVLADASRSFARAAPLLDADERRAFDDLALLFQEQDDLQAAFAQTDTTRASTADRYWALQDPRLLTVLNERRLEHNARLVYADLFFGSEAYDRRGWDTEIGRVLIRYGLPRHVEHRSIPEGKAYAPSKQWYYDDVQFSFVRPFPADAYLFTDYILSGAQEVFYKIPARSQYEPTAQREAIPFLVSTFKGPDGRTDVVVPFGVPVPFKPRRQPLGLTVRTGVFLLHPDRGLAVEQRQTHTTLANRQIVPFEDRALWLHTQHVQAVPDAYDLAVEFETETGRIVGYERTPVTIPSYAGHTLQLSDVLLAYEVRDAAASDAARDGDLLVRGNYAIRPAARPVFAVGGSIPFYVEVYHLTRQSGGTTAYTVEAVLVPWDDEGPVDKLLDAVFRRSPREGVSVRFSANGTTPDDAQHLVLDTAGQAPGRYVLALRVRDAVSGAVAETTRTLVLE